MVTNINIVGIGVNGIDTLTLKSIDVIKSADYIIGAKRMLEILPELKITTPTKPLIITEEIVAEIEKSDVKNIVILMSGDTGFHSGTTKLIDLLSLKNTKYNIEIYAGISSLQYMASKIKLPWQDVFLASAHGVDCNFIGTVLKYKQSFFLVGGKITALDIINGLYQAGFQNLTIYIGENLGYPDEKITKLELNSTIKMNVSSLAVVWVVREELFIDNYTGTLDDDDFIRGKVPITKSTIRNNIISQLGRGLVNEVIYDVGAGTGSIAIELALSNPMCKILAFENNPVAIDLIKQNIFKFNAYNITLIEGNAPETFENNQAPDKVFIGGSKGSMKSIFDLILKMNINCFFVVSAIAVETFAEVVDIFNSKSFSTFNILQLFVASNKKVANYNMLIGQNPTFIISGKL